MLKRFFLALVVLSPIFLQAQLVARTLKAANGQTIGFYEFTPSDYSKTGAKHPLIIFLHGLSERGNGTTDLSYITKVGIPKYIKNGSTMRFFVDGKWQSFVVLMPQLSASYGSWQLFYTEEMINYATKNLNIDENRVFLTGLSLGGGGVWSYASSSAANASKLAGIIPVCATCNMSNASNIVNQGVAVWAFHGDKDTRVSASCSINAINAIKALNPTKDAKLTLYNTTSHVIWDQAYDFEGKYQSPNVWEWMLKQSRSTKTSNKPPVVNAGSDITITLPTNTITLNGTASDPDGTISSFEWKKISGPGTFNIESPNSKITKVTNLVAGTYVFRLTSKDNDGAADYDDVTIKVNPEYNVAPIANAGKNIEITLPTSTTTLDGSGSSDSDGKIVKYEWKFLKGPKTPSIASPNSVKTSISGLVEGFYIFRLFVTDDDGAISHDDIGLTVKPGSTNAPEPDEPTGNKSPISNAGKDQTITSSSTRLDGSGSIDPDGSIAKYEWSKVSGPSSFLIVNKNNKFTEVRSLVPGKYIFRLTVYDNKQASNYDDVIITVNSEQNAPDASNKPPVANAGKDQTITSSSTRLDGSASGDPDGSIAKYEWKLINGPSSYNIAYKNNKFTEVSQLTEGKYTFRLTVYDNNQASAYDDVIITVNTPQNSPTPSGNERPIANAGPNQTISTSTTRLDGSKSFDPDGSISKYEWTMINGPSSYSISNKNNKFTNITDLKPGSYIFRLTVWDNNNESSYDDMGLTVTTISSNVALSSSSPTEELSVMSSPVNTLNADIKIYPNPSTSIINLSATISENGNAQINIYDVNGRLVKKDSFVKSQNLFQRTLEINDLQKGIYYVELILNTKRSSLSKFVKQ